MTANTPTLPLAFEELNIWQRIAPGRLVLYKVLRALDGRGYNVRSAHFFDEDGGELRAQMRGQEEYLLSHANFLLSADEEEIQSFLKEFRPTLAEALQAYTEDFEALSAEALEYLKRHKKPN